MFHQLSENSALRSLSCNYLRSAVSSNGTEIAVVVDASVGIFSINNFNRPVYKLPVRAEPGITSAIVHDIAWSPCHVGKGRWLAVATSEGKIDVWDVPATNVQVSRPQLLHSISVSTMLVSSNQSPPIVKSVAWHPCALPTLVVFFINHTAITVILPRRGREAEITTLTPSQDSQRAGSTARTAFTIGAVASCIAPMTSTGSSSSSGSSIGSLKRIYAMSKSTGQMCVFEDPLRDISRHVLVDTMVGGGSGGSGSGGIGVGDRKSAETKSVMRIGMLDERYETQVTLLLPFTLLTHPRSPPHSPPPNAICYDLI